MFDSVNPTIFLSLWQHWYHLHFDSINTTFTLTASIPPLLLPLASSFLPLLILASAYGILTGVRQCYFDQIFVFIQILSIVNQSQWISSNPNQYQSVFDIFNQSQSQSLTRSTIFLWSGQIFVSNNLNQSQSCTSLSTSFSSISILNSVNQSQAWIAATSPLLVSILGLNLLPAAFGIMTAGQVKNYCVEGKWNRRLLIDWQCAQI